MCGADGSLVDQFIQFVFRAIGIAGMVVDDIAFSVQHEDMRDRLHVHCALEVAIGVEQHIVLPAISIH